MKLTTAENNSGNNPPVKIDSITCANCGHDIFTSETFQLMLLRDQSNIMQKIIQQRPIVKCASCSQVLDTDKI